MTTEKTALRRPDISLSLATALSAVALAACQAPAGDSGENTGESGLAVHQNPKKEGKRLFEEETFGGNGRTCETCHSKKTGTLSPQDVQALFAKNPNHPLFLHDGSDDLQGNGVSRILSDATILVELPLPPGVTLLDDPVATSVVVRRGIPTTLNTPALDDVLMYDGRHDTLEDQALSAIAGHAQVDPDSVDPEELQLIAQHQRTKPFFSSPELWQYSQGGPAPALPQGHTAAQKRGRLWFEDADLPFAINQDTPRKGLCATCHSGPLLNTANGSTPLPTQPFPVPGCTPESGFVFPPGSEPNGQICDCNIPATTGDRVPAGTRFQSVLVSELNTRDPVYLFALQIPGAPPVVLPSPDPGRSLVTGNFDAFPVPGGEFSNFKIPILRGIKHTAPYFHDNSAKTLEEVVDHYARFFEIATDCNFDGDPALKMTPQDKADLVAFLKLL